MLDGSESNQVFHKNDTRNMKQVFLILFTEEKLIISLFKIMIRRKIFYIRLIIVVANKSFHFKSDLDFNNHVMVMNVPLRNIEI